MNENNFRTLTFQTLIDEAVLEIGDGYRAKNEELGGSGPIFLRAGHVTDTHIEFEGVERFRAEFAEKLEAKMSKPGDTIITTKGNSTGRTSFVTDTMPRFVYSPHLSYWRSKNTAQLANGFLRYWARSAEFSRQLAAMKTSTDMAPYLSLTDQRRLTITLPPPVEQQAIACILGALDDKIELNRRRNRTLEAMARAIFQSWFVDFDPVHAKAAGRKPAGLSKELAALFPAEFEDSELGEIPKGWRVGTVREIVSLSRDSLVPGEFPDEVFDHYSIPAYDAGQNPAHEVGETIKSQKFTVADDCVLVSKLNPKTPRIWLPEPASKHRRIASTEFLICRPVPKTGIGLAYFYYLSCDGKFTEYLTGRASGTSNSHQRVRPEDFLAHQIPIPSPELAGAFDAQARPLLDRVLLLKRESRTLASLRDALLPKLISGELRVPDAERIVGRAT